MTSTLLDRQRAAALTDAQLTALDLLARHGSARRVRVGWCFSSMDGPIIAPATMTALKTRGFVSERRGSATITGSGSSTRNAIIGRRA